MPDSPISDLPVASQVRAEDLFALEQGGVAKRLTGQTLTNWLTAYADGHGGIQSITLLSMSGLTKTYQILFADTTTSTFEVSDGNGIASVAWEDVGPGTSGNGVIHRGTFTFTNGTSNTLDIRDGFKGNTGEGYYVWIKYASVEPTTDTDMGTEPAEWIGIYSGPSDSAPVSYLNYTWHKIKGEVGETGDPAELEDSISVYAVGNDGTNPPQGEWSNTPPVVPQGSYLWTRTTLSFNSGSPCVFYTIARSGIDGSGSVSSVNSVSPDGNGNVELTSSNIQDGSGTVASKLAALSSLVYSAGDSVTQAELRAFGWVSSGAWAAVDVVLPKFVMPGASVTVTRFVPMMRISSGGYLGGDDSTECVGPGYVVGYSVEGNLLHVTLKKTGGWSAPNQTPTVGPVNVSFSIS